MFLFFLVISLDVFAKELPYVSYPFRMGRGILCDQGSQSPEGNSHTDINTLYALDLATPAFAEPAGILASIEGTVISYGDCIEYNTNCGAGFGNHVKILGDNGVLVLNAHLEKVFVKTGDFVKVGDLIGLEGNTGLTGSHNRHLHFSVHTDWRVYGHKYYEKYLGSVPPSVPFEMNICQKQYSTCGPRALDIRELKCKRMTGETEWVQANLL